VAQPRSSPSQHSAIRRQLEKIAAHGLFARSERMVRFLRLAVERTLEGKADELKEYLIGVEVFDRPSSYDPRVDPIVRVEARRLRSKLKAYYAGDGNNDPVRIEFRTGSYAPQIRMLGDGSVASRPDIHTIAVLPFANLSASAENDYFSDGLTEELIHALTRLRGMRVVAWNSAARLRGVEQDMQEVRRQLQVANVLTGSVRIAGPSLRVRAQLIDIATGVYLWSETFDRPMQDVFAIQEEIARNIVRTLRLQLSSGAEAALLARPHTSVSSYDYYLKGRYHLHRRTPDDLARGLQYFEAAVAVDPDSALAHAGLADAYVLLVDYGLLHPTEGVPKVRAAATRAIELDPTLADAYPSLAVIRAQWDREWQDAEDLYRKAIGLNPGCATAHHWLATDFLAVVGRLDEGELELEIALQLDPLSSIIHEGRASFSIWRRQYDEAVRRYCEIREFDPTFYKAYTGLGRAYALQGKYTEALAMLEKGRALAGDVPNILGAMGEIFALSGDAASARGILAQLTARALDSYVPSTCFARVHSGLGEVERALDWLEKGCEQRELPMAMLKVHPVYDPLRDEPRFQAVVERMRFP
jgi:TolB-like protein/Tfp pilus assembly protein PilF